MKCNINKLLNHALDVESYWPFKASLTFYSTSYMEKVTKWDHYQFFLIIFIQFFFFKFFHSFKNLYSVTSNSTTRVSPCEILRRRLKLNTTFPQDFHLVVEREDPEAGALSKVSADFLRQL